MKQGPNIAGSRYPAGDGVVGVPMHEQRHWEVEAIGEYREPKKEEWYLSGAHVAGYRAMDDLGQKYWMARPVKKRTTEEGAVAIGKQVARRAFQLRGNHTEIHLSEAELAALVSLGVLTATQKKV